MINNIQIRTQLHTPLIDYLENMGYIIDVIDEKILKVNSVGNESIFIVQEDKTLYFEMSLGEVAPIKNLPTFYHLLDLNSEIAPISIAINSEDEKDQLVLVERHPIDNLDGNELISILEAMELASIRVSEIIEFELNGTIGVWSNYIQRWS